MTTALILRDPNAPQVRVLEVDGPRKKHFRHGEGYWHLNTCNWQSCDDLELRDSDGLRAGCLRDWNQPYWEIYQRHDGSVEVHACRPTTQEVMRGDLFGRWGSVIYLGKNPSRQDLRFALQIARILGRCIPTIGFTINPALVLHFESIETEIPVRFPNGNLFLKPSPAA